MNYDDSTENKRLIGSMVRLYMEPRSLSVESHVRKARVQTLGKEIPLRTERPCGDKDSSAAWSEAQDEACAVLGSLHKTALLFMASALRCVKMPEGGEVSRCSQSSRT